MTEKHQITQLLLAWEQGDEAALEKLIPLVEKELSRLAKNYLRKEKSGHLLQTTALVNEAYLKLIDQKCPHWQNRAHFFAIAAKCMRRILCDYARTQKRQKRGGNIEHLPLSEVGILSPEKSMELLIMDEALNRLAKQDKQKSQIVELRFFGGYTLEETGKILNLPTEKVHREWVLAKAWLQLEMTRYSQTED